MVVLQLKNLPYLALLFLKMTVERNEPSFVSIIGKLDAMSFQLENEGLIYDLQRILKLSNFLATKKTLNIACNDT